jgi:hypothetical protein
MVSLAHAADKEDVFLTMLQNSLSAASSTLRDQPDVRKCRFDLTLALFVFWAANTCTASCCRQGKACSPCVRVYLLPSVLWRATTKELVVLVRLARALCLAFVTSRQQVNKTAGVQSSPGLWRTASEPRDSSAQQKRHTACSTRPWYQHSCALTLMHAWFDDTWPCRMHNRT